ncbi:DMT family transporter [Amylibacter sp. IMCC11727]|uniref:DMT family transporter n=1 Tax=Amylibacter sp. IMCC11727 TaxID=3039851 RepID=UPI00244E038F|nr:DMT family transporter [Amylibacter sp. IMCC11727]WGI20667.1 DMT family transporter [Amylibacter sp. IMCC11727]
MPKSRAMILILFGAVGMSLAALFVRLVDQADGFQILTYRSVSLAGIVGLMACLRRGSGPIRFLRSLDRADWMIGVILSLAFTTYVFALLNTSVASALFILAAAPLIAAILAWVWLGEKPSPMVWVTIALAGSGIAVMAGEGIALGRTTGNLYAFASATLFAIMLVLARRSGKDDVLGGTFLGGALSCAIAALCGLSIGGGLSVSPYDLMICLVMGAFTIGIGIGLVTWGTPYVPAAEVSLLVLLESVLSPIWVWVFLGEVMTNREIIGGGIVLAAVAALALVSTNKKRALKARS